MEITASMVKELRQLTGAGVLDCRKALETAGGDLKRAAELLREKGLAAAAKKATREVHEGLIGSYIHMGSKVAALVELNCETDFVARTADFQGLAKDLAMQIVAARPTWVRIEDVPADVLAQQTATYRAEVDPAKPAAVIEKIIEGKLAKFLEESCLLEQPFIKDETVRIKDLLTAAVAKLGENIVVRRFARLEVGG
ncbi:MAG: translation elongation factor Ts [Chloroflexi bacterium]|nr:translation elongation factor Ts [Chloroflexota bacterium]